MHYTCLWRVAGALLTMLVGCVWAGQPGALQDALDIDSQLQQKARDAGKVWVIVHLRLPEPWQPEAALIAANQHARVAQQQAAIKAVQSRILGLVPGSADRSTTRTFLVPAVAIEVTEAQLAALRAHPDVQSVSPVRELSPSLADSVPRIVKAQAAWNFGYSGSGQAVAILDTGVQADHPFLYGRVIQEACFSTPTSTAQSLCLGGYSRAGGPGTAGPCSGAECEHGTHVAGIAAGRQGFTGSAVINGVAKDASIIAAQVFHRDLTDGHLHTFDVDFMGALDWIYSMRGLYSIAAVNMSFGVGSYGSACDYLNPTLQSQIAQLRAANIAAVISSGNDASHSGISYPACISGALSVGASDKSDLIAPYTNRYSNLTMLATGDSITSSVPGSSYAVLSGTSMAAPHVTGAFALMRQVLPGASVQQIVDNLTAVPTYISDSPPSTLRFARLNLQAPINSLFGVTRLVNISTRGYVGFGDQVLIAGLTISGSAPKTIAVQGLGPSLANYGIAQPLGDPVLQVIDMSTNTQIASNNWWSLDGRSQDLKYSGFAPSMEREAALLLTLNPGQYSVILSGAPMTVRGVGLVAVYEVDQAVAAPMVNLSTRGTVLTGENVLIGGFILGGPAARNIVVQGIGPSLADYGVSGALMNPYMDLFSGPNWMGANDDWGTDYNAGTLQAIGYAPAKPAESAMLRTLNPGGYTAIISGVNSTTGVGLFAIYMP